MIKHQPDNSKSNLHYDSRIYRDLSFYKHFHKNFEIIHVLEGSLRVAVNGTERTLRCGDFAFILSNQIHSFDPVGGAVFWIVVFSEDYVSRFAGEVRPYRADEFVFRCDAAVTEMVKKYLIYGDCSPYMRKAGLYALCDRFLSSVKLLPRAGKSDFLAGRILDYIALNYTADISLKSCATELGYEYHYLSRLLEKNYQINFRQVLNDYRVDHSVRLLSETDLPVTEIAFSSGFQSIRSFNSIIKAHAGKTPSQLKGNRNQTERPAK